MLTPDDKRKLKLDKQVQYYMALVTGWINTRMEHDKTIITISSGAIGLLITILTTKGPAATWHIWLYGFTFICYLAAIITGIKIFKDNSARIEKEIQDEENEESSADTSSHDLKLDRLDAIFNWSFIIGTVAFVVIGILAAVAISKETKLKKDDEKPMKFLCYCNHTSTTWPRPPIPQAIKKRKHPKQATCQPIINNCIQGKISTSQ